MKVYPFHLQFSIRCDFLTPIYLIIGQNILLLQSRLKMVLVITLKNETRRVNSTSKLSSKKNHLGTYTFTIISRGIINLKKRGLLKCIFIPAELKLFQTNLPRWIITDSRAKINFTIKQTFSITWQWSISLSLIISEVIGNSLFDELYQHLLNDNLLFWVGLKFLS